MASRKSGEVMMQIHEYDDVDSLNVLHLNLLGLGFALTPELVAKMRRLDPRSFSFFALYAQMNHTLAGQVGVFRLPVVSTRDVEEVGGIWALSTHPLFTRRGVANLLLDEAHSRMRTAGLRYSTLGTNRSQVAYSLYKKLGYEEAFSWANVIAARATLSEETHLEAERAGVERLPLADQIFAQIAKGRLGFARRHVPFFSSLDKLGYLSAQDLWMIWDADIPVGYAAVIPDKSVLKIANLLVHDGVDPVRAVAAIVHKLDASYIQIRVDRRAETVLFVRAGFRLAEQEWGVFMVKPLTTEVTVDHFRALYGADTERFLLSYLDVT